MSVLLSVKSLVRAIAGQFQRPGMLVLTGAAMSLTVISVSVYLVLYAGHSMLPGPLTARLAPAPPEVVEVQVAPAPTQAPGPAATQAPAPAPIQTPGAATGPAQSPLLVTLPAPAAYLLPAPSRAPVKRAAAAAPEKVQVAQVGVPAKAGSSEKSSQQSENAGLSVDDYEGEAASQAISGNLRWLPCQEHSEAHGKGHKAARPEKKDRED